MKKNAYKRLPKLHERYLENTAYPTSQMCLIWSTDDLPDVLLCTESMDDILDEFDIDLTEFKATDLYDMNLLEASVNL